MSSITPYQHQQSEIFFPLFCSFQPSLSTEPENSRKPRLPPELWLTVLDNFRSLTSPGDLVWLWLAGRHVSQVFMHGIEEIFRAEHLPRIGLCCGETFALDRMSNENSSAIFSLSSEYTSPDAPRSRSVPKYLHKVMLAGLPLISIIIRGIVNDTGVPDLMIHSEEGEISFDWRGMFTQLLGEEHVFNMALSRGLGWPLCPRYPVPGDHTKHRRIARRSRLQRESRARFQTNILDRYVRNEAVSLSSLRRKRMGALRKEEGRYHAESVCSDDISTDPRESDSEIDCDESEPEAIPHGICAEQGWPNRNKRPSSVDLFDRQPAPPPSKREDLFPRLTSQSSPPPFNTKDLQGGILSSGEDALKSTWPSGERRSAFSFGRIPPNSNGPASTDNDSTPLPKIHRKALSADLAGDDDSVNDGDTEEAPCEKLPLACSKRSIRFGKWPRPSLPDPSTSPQTRKRQAQGLVLGLEDHRNSESKTAAWFLGSEAASSRTNDQIITGKQSEQEIPELPSRKRVRLDERERDRAARRRKMDEVRQRRFLMYPNTVPYPVPRYYYPDRHQDPW